MMLFSAVGVATVLSISLVVLWFLSSRRFVLVNLTEDTCRWDGQLDIPIHYEPRIGVHMVTVGIGVGPGRFRNVKCVLDTGSRHLTVARSALGRVEDGTWIPVAGPSFIHYGTQTDAVRWVEAPVRVSGRRVCHDMRNVTLAVAGERKCRGAGCFNVLGLSVGAGATVPFLTQLARHAGVRPTFCIAMRRNGTGSLRINHECADRNARRIRLLDHPQWYLVRLDGVVCRGTDDRPVASCPSRLMVDTGSNQLGGRPDFFRALRTTLRPGDALVFRLRDTADNAFEYVVPPSAYTHAGHLLFDPHQESDNDVLVLGSMFMRGFQLTVDVAARELAVSANI